MRRRTEPFAVAEAPGAALKVCQHCGTYEDATPPFCGEPGITCVLISDRRKGTPAGSSSRLAEAAADVAIDAESPIRTVVRGATSLATPASEARRGPHNYVHQAFHRQVVEKTRLDTIAACVAAIEKARAGFIGEETREHLALAIAAVKEVAHG